MSRYEMVNPELSATIASAGWVRQRQIVEGLVRLVKPLPDPETAAAYAALDAHQYGDTELRRQLLEAAAAAEDRYEQLRDQQDEAEESDQDFPAELVAEVNRHRRAARLNLLLAKALSEDANEAAQEAAYLAPAFVPAVRVEQMIKRMFTVGQTLARYQGTNAWIPEHREPTDAEVRVAFENGGEFWYDSEGKGPFAGRPHGDGWALFHLI